MVSANLIPYLSRFIFIPITVKSSVMTVLFAFLACTDQKQGTINEPSPVEDTGSIDTAETNDTNANDTSIETGDTNPDTDTTDTEESDTSTPYNQAYFKSMHNAYSGEERGTIHEQLDAGFRGLEFDIHDNDFANIGDYQLGHFSPGGEVERGHGNPNTVLLSDWLSP